MAAPRRTHDSSQSGVTSADRRTARELVSLLGDRNAHDRFELKGKDGRAATLSAPMISLIERAARIVAEGTAVDVFARDKELTTQEAAEFLGVSRQYLVRLLDRGDIPFARTGNHRRVKSVDVLAFREKRDIARRDALSAITQELQSAGGYSTPVKLGPKRSRQG